jgi:hypothetical protein
MVLIDIGRYYIPESLARVAVGQEISPITAATV